MAESFDISASLSLDDSGFREPLENAPEVAESALEEVNEVVVSALDEATNAVDKAIDDTIGVVDDGFDSVEDKVEDTVADVNGELEKIPVETQKSMSTMAIAVGNILAQVAMRAFGIFKRELSNTITLWGVQEDAVNHLERALKKAGASGDWSESLQKTASDLQSVTKYGDEAILKIMSLGLNMGLQAQDMEMATKSALGLASTTGQSLDGAMANIAKAYHGKTEELANFGIVIDKTRSKQEQFADVLKQTGAMFPNAEAQTMTEKLTQVSNAWGDVKEQIGRVLVGILGLDDATGGITEKLAEMASWLSENANIAIFCIREIVMDVWGAMKSIWTTVYGVGKMIWEAVYGKFRDIWSIGQWVFENFVKIISNFPSYLWSVLKDMGNLVYNFGKTIVGVFADIGKAIWQALTSGSLDGFGGIIESLQENLETMKSEAGGSLKEWAKNVGATAFPEMSASIGEVFVSGTGEILDELARISDETARSHAENERKYADSMISKKDKGASGKANGANGANGVEASRNVDIVGSFSSRMLSGMIGANSPMAQIASGTKKNGALLEKIANNTENFGEEY